MGLSWWLNNVLGGAVRWAVATIIGAICLVLGLAPAAWLAGIFGNPPAWVMNPWKRIGIVVVGVVTFLLILLVRRRKDEANLNIPVRWKNVTIQEPNLVAYMRSSDLVRRLDERISERSGNSVDPDNGVALPVEETAKLLGISDIEQLDLLLRENQEAAVRMSFYSWLDKDTAVPRGECLLYLLDVLGAQLGEPQFSELRSLQSLIQGGDVKARCQNYAEIMKNISPKPPIRVPLVVDFNLIPIESAIDEVRAGLKGTPQGKEIEANGKTKEQQDLDYWRLIGPVRLYGTERGQKSRKLINFMLYVVNAVTLESGRLIWTIPNGPVFDDLFVMAPDLRSAIQKIKQA
ncbi:hypothetical protein [Bradyrhizobium uaiense]|uniref:Uncharacterized protein n=1 Tax=Bradyrhizobium uaiense TaxID=2594946 RepID=A0A6P1BMS1_9BRAD|nr:hypothetical protein [Bradyrhizobium uaiense]NEU98882.1 hypothetical protein [Bradyrhizobium uaiense]